MAAEIIGYGIFRGTHSYTHIVLDYIKVYPITSIGARRVFYRTGSATRPSGSSCEIGELIAFRKTEAEAKQFLDEMKAACKDLDDAYEVANKKADEARRALQDRAQSFREKPPQPQKSKASKLQEMKTSELEAELQRRKGG